MLLCFLLITNLREVKPLGDYSYDSERRKKTTIIILIIIILILLATIVGLTYALFTSGGDDGKIGINVTSGECKIDIVSTEDKSLVGDVLDFVTAEKKEKIYFEPGATYYTEGFEVKNVGNIPVNFRVYISEDEENDRYDFEEAFELWITKDTADIENAEKLTSFTGRLEVDQTSETYYLVIRMKESAGNEFQNKTYTGIGVTVYAVQGNVDIGE